MDCQLFRSCAAYNSSCTHCKHNLLMFMQQRDKQQLAHMTTDIQRTMLVAPVPRTTGMQQQHHTMKFREH